MSAQHHPPHHPAHHPRYTGWWLGGLLALVVAGFAGMGVHDRMQARAQRDNDARQLTGGDPSRGPAIMRMYGCAQCHTIPGVDGANGLVGPPLAGIAKRVYLGGVLTNTPEHMVQWIMDPRAFDPKTAMPDVGISEEQARHVAAYLYTLQ